MPVKLGNKLPDDHAEARIEIVPLIDIMFFLLASFMLVSLSMVTLKAVKVNLPTATTAGPEVTHDIADVSVDKDGGIFLDTKPIADHELVTALASQHQANSQLRVFISGDRDARHGEMIHVLDLIRTAGIDRVAFEITPENTSEQKANGT